MFSRGAGHRERFLRSGQNKIIPRLAKNRQILRENCPSFGENGQNEKIRVCGATPQNSPRRHSHTSNVGCLGSSPTSSQVLAAGGSLRSTPATPLPLSTSGLSRRAGTRRRQTASHRFVLKKLQNVARKRHLFLAATRTCGVAPPGQCHPWAARERRPKLSKSSPRKTAIYRDRARGNLGARLRRCDSRPNRFVALAAARMPKCSGKTSLATKIGGRTCCVIAPSAQDRRDNAEFLGENAACRQSQTANLCDSVIGHSHVRCPNAKTIEKKASRSRRRPANLCGSHDGLTPRRSGQHVALTSARRGSPRRATGGVSKSDGGGGGKKKKKKQKKKKKKNPRGYARAQSNRAENVSPPCRGIAWFLQSAALRTA